MPRAPKACGRYGCPNTVTGATYCTPCQAERDALRTARAPLSPSSREANRRHERARRAATIREWVANNGWICPGYRRDPHPSRDLTAAHLTAVAHGGGPGPLTVLCRPCNSRQGTRPT